MPISMRTYSTPEVAKMLGMYQPNLQRLIARKRIPFPPLVRVGRLKIRLWTARDVKRARQALAKGRTRRK
jgi:predicted DNA-binding transcriptional regulator AlpA